jgi:signal-transduction protein with cAMP-binding, CBS, and nucleotidyltransferase domain
MRTVKDIMKPIIKIGSQQTVLEAAHLMKLTDQGSLLVVEDDIYVGILTERDLLMRVVAEDLPHSSLVSTVMSSPLRVVDANTSLRKAAEIMCEHKIRRLPIKESGAIVGIVAASDVLRQLSKKTLTEEIKEALTEKH